MSLIETDALVGQTVAVDDLTPEARTQMYQLMANYYENVSRSSFDQDLAGKRWAILATDRDGAVKGFSTQRLVPLRAGGQALFSGDTVVDRAFWGRNPIAAEWGRLALDIYAAEPDRELFWFLIAKGYKTYRLLATYFVDYYPRRGAVTPPWAADLVDELAAGLFRSRYERGSGIVAAGPTDQRLRWETAPVGSDQLGDPDVAYFDRRNPGHRNGDELCCVARLGPENLNERALELIGSR